MDNDIEYADSGGTNIAYRTLGDGERDVLVVLPWASNLDVLTDYPAIARSLERLTALGRVILFDRRGSGLSDRLCGPATLESGMDDILAVLDAVGSRKASVVGVHEAGALCILLAATHPERVSELVLYAAFAAATWHPDYPWGQRPEERDEEIALVLDTWGTPLTAMALINPGASTDERFLRWAARWQRGSVSRDALPTFFDILARTDVRHVLAAVRVPTLILHRPGSPVVPVENAHYLHERIAGSKVVLLPGEDFLPFLGEIDDLADEIEEFLTGARRPRDSDRILATLLFCDVVDSTIRARELGDARWNQVLDELDLVVREQVEWSGGRVVKRLGDGYLVTFDRPARAIRCAARIRDVARALELSLRSGLHAGEVEVRADDVAGIAVHIAARVMELAAPDEIAVSSAVPPLIAGSGIRFEDRGEHELRGVEGTWHIHAVAER